MIAAVVLLPGVAQAQIDNSTLDIVDEPICFIVRNTANYGVLGDFKTAEYQREDGIISRHRSNFRFDEAGAVDEDGNPSDRAEFCSYGPFMPNRTLELTIRTLFPVFSCDTRVDQGEILIRGDRLADDSGVQTWAECYREDGTLTGRPPK